MTMARMPYTDWLGEHGSASITSHDIVCVHTIVGYAPAHAAHFSTRATGWIGQSRDTALRSAANLNGNHRVIAIENEDHGDAYGAWSGSNVPGFTAAQMESIANILVFCYRAHGIPLVPCPDSRPGSRGIAYHRQGCDGNFAGYAYPGRIPAGELWSSASGKVCPGDRRITQLLNIIIPRARVLAGLDSPEEVDMLADERNWLKAVYDGIYAGGPSTHNESLANTAWATKQDTIAIRAAVGQLTDDEASVLAAVSGAKGEVLAALALIDGTPSDEQVADLADKLNAQLGGAYSVTITPVAPTE